jgi:hypothetical protein
MTVVSAQLPETRGVTSGQKNVIGSGWRQLRRRAGSNLTVTYPDLPKVCVPGFCVTPLHSLCGGGGRKAVFTHVSLAGLERREGATLYGSKWHGIYASMT